jgi:hypothetical protein
MMTTRLRLPQQHLTPRLPCWIQQTFPNLGRPNSPLFFTSNMDRLPLAAIIVLVSLIVTLMIVLVLGTVYTVYYS